jgi:hypothetical protein
LTTVGTLNGADKGQKGEAMIVSIPVNTKPQTYHDFQIENCCLQHVVAFVLNLPSRTAGFGQGLDISINNAMRSGPRIAIDHLAILVGGGQFKPVDHEGIIGIA